MSEDRLGNDVRIPQAASVATNRRRVLTFALTGASALCQVRDPAAADGECWITLWHNIPTNPVCWHGGRNSPTALPAATAADWTLPQNTERSYKLARNETHIAALIVGGVSGDLKVYVSSD